jgi:protein tyrosine phosphatase (PTP) superfamily phosphohydrolase (DUF442 family)
MNALRLMVIVALLAAAPLGCKSKTDEGPTNQEQATPEQATEEATEEAPKEEASVELELANAAEPIEGITTSGQPSRDQFTKLREAGYRGVINLRTPGELSWDEGTEAVRQKIGYVQIPIGGPGDLTRENVEKFDEALKMAPDGGKVLVHCGSSNRVGAMFALRAKWIQGKSLDEALALGKKAGLTSLQGTVTELLQDE